MKSYNATFRKKDGNLREMNFAKLKDLPPEFLSGKVKGKSAPPLKEGHELVWDLDVKEFRIVNWTTIIGEVKEEEINFVL
jgi:hypothetical protein